MNPDMTIGLVRLSDVQGVAARPRKPLGSPKDPVAIRCQGWRTVCKQHGQGIRAQYRRSV